MKIEEKKTGRLELRIPVEDLELFKIAAYSIGSTPSQLLRMYVNSTIVALKAKQKAGEINLENVKVLFNDKL